MSAGLNRHTEEAGRNQTVDALNVTNDRGDLRRRDAYAPVGSAPPHLLPAGLATVYTEIDGAGLVAVPSRNPSMVGINRLYVGNRRYLSVAANEPDVWGQFCGIDWRHVTVAGGAPAEHYRLVPQYYTGAAWVDMPAWVDETVRRVGNYLLPLAGNGRIYWHLPQFSSLWNPTPGAPPGPGMFVRLEVRALDNDALTSLPFATLQAGAPGIRIFNFAPVNGLFSVRVRNRSSIIVGSDRMKRRTQGSTGVRDNDYAQGFAGGLEKGAHLGCKTENAGETRTMYLLEDEGAAVYGTVAWPQNQRSGVLVGAAGLTYGTANRLQKTRRQFFRASDNSYVPYVWPPGKFRGGRLTNDLTAAALTTTSILRVNAGSGLLTKPGYYRGCRLVCTTAGGGGVALDEEVEIFDHDYDGIRHYFYLNPAHSAVAVGGDRFRIYGPHAIAYLANQPHVYEIRNNAAHTMELASGKNYAPSPALINPVMGHFRAGRELRWVAEAGDTWSGVVDPVTGDFLCTNGHTGLLTFDGWDLRVLRADYNGPQALRIAGELPDELKAGQTEPRAVAMSALRKEPPRGKYVAVHRNRIFVAGFSNEPLTVKWSAFGGANNVWPLVCEDLVRDAEEDPITGMVSLGERLLVFTKTAIHEAIDIDVAPYFSFAPMSKGIGFVGPNAVCSYIGADNAERVFGVAPDGLYSAASGEPTIVLDNWTRLFREGVNTQQLYRACVVFMPQASSVMIAIAESGSAINNRMIRYDTIRESFWVWSLPFGCSSLAVDYDQYGRERLLIGTDDGYVMTLVDGETDDGTAISSYAITPPVQGPGGHEVQLSGAVINAMTIGATLAKQMEVDVMSGDNLDQPLQEGMLTIDKGDPTWNGGQNWTATAAATASSPRYQARAFKSVKLNIAATAKAHRFALKIGGACRWVFKNAEMLVRGSARRGR